MWEARDRARATTLFAAIVLAAVVFTLWPGLDLAVSRLFWTPQAGFWIGDIEALRLVREVIRVAMYLMPLVALLLIPVALTKWAPWGVPARLWAFVFVYFLTGPLWLANIVFKNNWGRARPEDVTEFGGELTFSPALRWVDECARNCSFVSGEGSGATAMAVCIVLLAPYLLKHMPKRRRKTWVRVALIIPAVAIVLRVMMGRHFLSDTIFAVLFMLAVALFLYGPLVRWRSQ